MKIFLIKSETSQENTKFNCVFLSNDPLKENWTRQSEGKKFYAILKVIETDTVLTRLLTKVRRNKAEILEMCNLAKSAIEKLKL